MSTRTVRARNGNADPEPEQTVDLAEALAEQSGPEAITAALQELAVPIRAATERLNALRAQRTELWAQGLALGMSKVALGKAAGVSDTMVSTRTSKAKAKAG